MAFALSTDYGVFLLARIREARRPGVSEREAIARGMQRSGPLITSAAILLAVAIGAFVISKLIFLKEVGVGVAAAVLIDAFIVRALLVPSLMALLGCHNWWAPPRLRTLHRWLAFSETETPQEVVPPASPCRCLGSQLCQDVVACLAAAGFTRLGRRRAGQIRRA